MSGYEVLVVFIAAAAGFGAYAAGGRGPAPLRRMRDVVTPIQGLVILAAAAAMLGLVKYVIARAALPGEALYVLKQVVRAYSIPSIFGFLFGVGFGIWVNYFVTPDGLAGERARIIHRRWGFGLLVLFLTGVLHGPIERLLPRLTGISTPAVSLDFGKGSEEEAEPAVASVGSGGGGGGSRIQTLRWAAGYMGSVYDYVMRDGEYVRSLHGEASQDLKSLEGKALRLTDPIAECFGMTIRNMDYVRDAGAIQASFGSAVSDGAAWFRSVLADNENQRDGGARVSLAGMYERLPVCQARSLLVKVEDVGSEASELPYFALAIAHMMQLAGQARDGADILALWIDRSLRADVRPKIANWYRIRAYVHLSILLEGTGHVLERRDVLGQGVRLFEETLRTSPTPELRDVEMWAKSCLQSRRDKGNRDAESDILERIRFTFMTLSNRWIRLALDSGRVTADLLKYAERNTSMPESCYPKGLGDTAYSRADFLIIHARLLMALAARKYYILPEGGKDLESYRDAREYLLRALALLRPMEREEGAEDEDRPAGHVVDGYIVSYEVGEAERHLRRTEAALGVR